MVDLNLIYRFKDLPINDYMQIRKAVYASQNADNGNIDDALEWLEDIDSTGISHPFIVLAKAHIDLANGEKVKAKDRINYLNESYEGNSMLNRYIGIYFVKQNRFEEALKYFKLAVKYNNKFTEHLSELGAIYFELNYFDSSAIAFTRVIEKDSMNLNAYFNRANCMFEIGKDNDGCRDIKKMIEIAPKIKLPDSILVFCDLMPE